MTAFKVLRVAVTITSIGDKPAFSRSSISKCELYPGKLKRNPASVPNDLELSLRHEHQRPIVLYP